MWARELARDLDEALERGLDPVGRRAPEREAPDGLEVLGERHPGGRGDVLGSELDAGVRVDPPRSGRGDRRGAVERQPGGVREQVA